MAIVTPYNNTNSKKEQVKDMFNNIAHRYDFMNTFLSLGIHHLWRKKAIRLISKNNPKHILDVATGTADFAIEALKLNPSKVTGIDLSESMLAEGRKKLIQKNIQNKIELLQGDCENLPFTENTFDAITAGFGVRNFENLEKGLSNMHRVLKPGGTIAILEFSKPSIFPVKQLFNFYFTVICPFLGRMFSKDTSAYSYLHESVNAFPSGKEFTDIMQKTGFKDNTRHSLTFGVASIYVGKK